MSENKCVNCEIKTAFINSMQESLDTFSVQVHRLKKQIGEFKKEIKELEGNNE